MQTTAAAAGILHGGEQRGVRKKLAILDHQLDASAVHVNDASGADVEVTDFAIAHLSVGQANIFAAGVNERVGILLQQAVVAGLACQRDGVGAGFSTVAPAVENDEDERFGTHVA